MSYPVSDDLVGPISDELVTMLKTNIPAIGRTYDTEPDGPLEHNSLLIPVPGFKIISDTNGKLYLKLTYQIRHISRSGPFSQQVKFLFGYVMPYLKALSAWPNNTLNDEAIMVDIKGGGIGRWIWATQQHIVLVINIEVMTEFNIDLF